jgi:transposase
LRERVLAAADGGLPARVAAEQFGVSFSFIYKALKRRRVSGETTARAQRNQQALKLAAQHAAILAEVERRPDVTLDELRAWLLETHGIEASLGLMHNTLIRLGLTLEDAGRAPCGAVGTPQRHGGEQDRPDIAEQRTAWRAGQAALSRGRLIFIPAVVQGRNRCFDEAGPSLRPVPARSTARRGAATRPLEGDGLRRRPDKPSFHSTLRARRCDGLPNIPGPSAASWRRPFQGSNHPYPDG